MILGRYEILKLVKEKRLIENFFEKSLQQAGYDLRIKTAYRIKGEPYLKGEERILPNIEEITEDYEYYLSLLKHVLVIAL